MAAEFPLCSVCRSRIQPGDNVVFSADSRVHHLSCPKVLCPLCSLEILPQQPIRRDREVLVHGNCWARRQEQSTGVLAPAPRDRTDIVRARLASGALPVAEPTKLWGGMSTGSVCGGCTERIVPGQLEYELQFANAILFRLHRTCYVIWKEQHLSVRRAINGGSAAASWTSLFEHSIARCAGRDAKTFQELRVISAEVTSATRALRERSRGVRMATALPSRVSPES
jgi:hypothetical protein